MDTSFFTSKSRGASSGCRKAVEMRRSPRAPRETSALSPSSFDCPDLRMSPPSDPTVKGLGALTETFDGSDLRVLIVHARLVTSLPSWTASSDTDATPQVERARRHASRQGVHRDYARERRQEGEHCGGDGDRKSVV